MSSLKYMNDRLSGLDSTISNIQTNGFAYKATLPMKLTHNNINNGVNVSTLHTKTINFVHSDLVHSEVPIGVNFDTNTICRYESVHEDSKTISSVHFDLLPYFILTDKYFISLDYSINEEYYLKFYKYTLDLEFVEYYDSKVDNNVKYPSYLHFIASLECDPFFTMGPNGYTYNISGSSYMLYYSDNTKVSNNEYSLVLNTRSYPYTKSILLYDFFNPKSFFINKLTYCSLDKYTFPLSYLGLSKLTWNFSNKYILPFNCKNIDDNEVVSSFPSVMVFLGNDPFIKMYPVGFYYKNRTDGITFHNYHANFYANIDVASNPMIYMKSSSDTYDIGMVTPATDKNITTYEKMSAGFKSFSNSSIDFEDNCLLSHRYTKKSYSKVNKYTPLTIRYEVSPTNYVLLDFEFYFSFIHYYDSDKKFNKQIGRIDIMYIKDSTCVYSTKIDIDGYYITMSYYDSANKNTIFINNSKTSKYYSIVGICEEIIANNGIHLESDQTIEQYLFYNTKFEVQNPGNSNKILFVQNFLYAWDQNSAYTAANVENKSTDNLYYTCAKRHYLNYSVNSIGNLVDNTTGKTIMKIPDNVFNYLDLYYILYTGEMFVGLNKNNKEFVAYDKTGVKLKTMSIPDLPNDLNSSCLLNDNIAIFVPISYSFNGYVIVNIAEWTYEILPKPDSYSSNYAYCPTFLISNSVLSFKGDYLYRYDNNTKSFERIDSSIPGIVGLHYMIKDKSNNDMDYIPLSVESKIHTIGIQHAPVFITQGLTQMDLTILY